MLFIFDMGGVVTTTCKLDRVYEKLNVSEQQFKEICTVSDDEGNTLQLLDQMEIGALSVDEFWYLYNKQISDNPNLPQVHNDLFRMYFHPQIHSKTVEIIQKLKAAGHRVVCGTNTMQSHWENHLERGDYAYFDQTYASNKIGVAKPDEDFFRVILDAEECKPCNAFFTDDKEKNCIAAQKAGINAHHFTSSDDLYEAWKKYF